MALKEPTEETTGGAAAIYYLWLTPPRCSPAANMHTASNELPPTYADIASNETPPILRSTSPQVPLMRAVYELCYLQYTAIHMIPKLFSLV